MRPVPYRILAVHHERRVSGGGHRVHHLERESQAEPALPGLAPAPRRVVVGEMKEVGPDGQRPGHRRPTPDIRGGWPTRRARYSRWPRPSPGAFLGVRLDEPLRHQDEPKNLCPFRDDVAHDLSPLGLGVHPPIEGDPREPRDQQKDAQGVIAQPLPHRSQRATGTPSALGGASLVEVLRGKRRRRRPGPVGDGIPEEQPQ